jgi:hypothetical protein
MGRNGFKTSLRSQILRRNEISNPQNHLQYHTQGIFMKIVKSAGVERKPEKYKELWGKGGRKNSSLVFRITPKTALAAQLRHNLTAFANRLPALP